MNTISSPTGVFDLPPIFPDNTWVALDTELFGLQEPLHRPNSGSLACLTVCAEPDTVYAVTDTKDVQSVLDRLKNCVWVMQNAKFDITHLRRWAFIPPRKKLWDTMLIERLMYGGLYDRFGLDYMTRRYLDIYLEKETRDLFQTATEMTDELWKYSLLDPVVTLLIAKEQRKRISKREFGLWKDADQPTLWAVMDMPGFRLDVGKWIELAERNKARADEIEASLPVNPRSHKKVKELLVKKGFKRLPNTQATKLEEYVIKYPDVEAAELAEQILLARKYSKASSTYGKNWIEKYVEQESDGVQIIVGDFHVTGAETGRMSSSSPNMQNVPAKDTSEFRECFIARPNNKIVVADYGQQEARIAAYLSQDQELIKILRNKDVDIFVQMVKLIYHKDVNKKDPLRDRVKNLVYGLIYDLSEHGFAKNARITVEEAIATRDAFFSIFKQLKRWMDKQRKQKAYAETISGRKIWLNPYSGQIERNAINGPIQGEAANMMKKSAGLVFYDWPVDLCPYSIVAFVHDEIVADVPEGVAHEIGQFVTKNMVKIAEDTCPGIPFTADYAVGDTWAAKG